MPCWDHDAMKKPAILAGFSRRGPQQAMIHGLFPLRGVPLKLLESLRSEFCLNPCTSLHFPTKKADA